MLVFHVNSGITLRLLEVQHALQLFRCIQANRQYLQRWLAWVCETQTVEDCWQFIMFAQRQAEVDAEFHFGVWREDQLVGVLGVHTIDSLTKDAEIGYWLKVGEQGKGIMSMAIVRLLRYLFVEQGLNRIEIRCAESNVRSQLVAKRLGFQLVGMLYETENVDDKLNNLLIYEMLRSKWESL